MDGEIDLPAYFRRIDYSGKADPTLAVLRTLHERHPAQIPFEGLDPFLGRPVSIAPASVQRKLVRESRGGYCHEQNLLFYEVLKEIGFNVIPLGARVLWMSPGRSAPMTHRLTLVRLPEGDYLADVGFGGQTYTAPLRLKAGIEQATPHGSYRVIEQQSVWDTQMMVTDRWESMYRFTLAPQSVGDFEMANWFTSTHPKTRFRRNLVAARIIGETRVNLLNTTITRRRADSTDQRTLESAQGLGEVLEKTMGLRLPVPAEEIWQRLPQEPAPQWP